MITTPQMLMDAQTQDMELVNAALANSTSVARFDTGWPIDVREVQHGAPALASTTVPAIDVQRASA